MDASENVEARVDGRLWRLSLLTVINRFANSFTVVVLPLYALAIGTDEAFYGLMTSAAGYVQSGVLFPAGTLSDRRGRGLALLAGGLIGGVALILLPFATSPLIALLTYALTGAGTGLTASSLRTLIADYTARGYDRTRSYGIVDTLGVLVAVAGPFIGGYILDPRMFPWLSEEMSRFVVVFLIMGASKVVAGFLGLSTEMWLRSHTTQGDPLPRASIIEPELSEPLTEEELRQSREITLLFGLAQLVMGFSSGMVVPYLIPWVNAAFRPDPFVLGMLPSVANISLATGTLFVGLTSERAGKIKVVFLLYLATPFLTMGLVYAPAFIVMAVFFISRMSVANMVRPATTSLFMEGVSTRYRARAWAVTRLMWTFSRQTGTLLTALLLTQGLFGGIVGFGILVFPVAMMFYPVSVLPMWIAVKRMRSRA